jgi:hypothetical protein
VSHFIKAFFLFQIIIYFVLFPDNILGKSIYDASKMKSNGASSAPLAASLTPLHLVGREGSTSSQKASGAKRKANGIDINFKKK